MSHRVVGVSPTELLPLISAQQADPRTATRFLESSATLVKAQVDHLTRADATRASAARDSAGRVVGGSLVQWDAYTGSRAWIYGPWALPSAWDAVARPLLNAALGHLPASVAEIELGFDLRNERLAALGASLGWHRRSVGRVYVADTEAAVTWPRFVPDVRVATPADLPALSLLHGLEFAGDYTTARNLIEDPDQVTLVLQQTGQGVLGYASGHIATDGAAHLDFIVVDPTARGLGDGRRLLAAVLRALLDRSTAGRVYVTVDERRRPAIGLYEDFGFRFVSSVGGYCSAAPSAA